MNIRFRFHKNLGFALGMVFLLSACASGVNWNYQRTPSTAFAEPKTTRVGALFQEVADQHPGLSGFALIQQGQDALLARVAMADLAEKTLDAQYYIWDGDITGKILADRLLQAADRGVRVRVLIDDHYLTKVRDFRLAVVDSHPNIEIRFFNPVANRRWRMISFLLDFGRVNHRMHNKLFVMDDALGIVGGRNIADIYFGVNAQQNFRDLDVMMAGPIVNEISSSFDLFWNSQWAVPVGAVVRKLASPQDLPAIKKRLEEQIGSSGYPYPIRQSIDNDRARLVQVRDQFVWAPGRVFVERPSRVNDADTTRVITTALNQRLDQVKHEVSIETPYFVLSDQGIETARQLTARGVKVRVLTNSAATNDILAAHAGYANTRMQLLKAGVELYELRPDSKMQRKWSIWAKHAQVALHAKTVSFDRQSVWIGSFNLDPRSAALNTEIGVLIDSPQVAGQVGALMDAGVVSGSAYHVTLDKNNNLVWTAEKNGEKVEYRKDPGISPWCRFKIGVLRRLPIKNQL